MFSTLRSHFVATFVGLTLGILLLVGLVINLSLHQHFEAYLQEKVRERSEQVALLLGQTYDQGWPQLALNDVTHWMLTEGLAATISSPDGRLIWSSEENARQMGGHLMPSPPVSPPSDFAVEVPIRAQGQRVGTLTVFAGPGGLLTHHDLAFRQSVNRILWVAAAAGLAIALILGWLVARKLHDPLMQMTEVARSIQNGNWHLRAPTTGAFELQQLGVALNHLTHSLEAQEAIRKRMTRDVAHELRTPLSILQSHLEAIQDGVWAPTPDRLSLCHGEVLRLVRLVDDLNRLAEAEAKAAHINAVATPLRPFMLELADAVEPLFARQGISFTHETPPDLTLVFDRDQVRQILLNLLDNARKYTPQGGRTVLRTTLSAAAVQIAVADTGCGVDPKEIPLLFERFYRGDPSRSRRTGGAGLGLAIARALSEAHGGRIEVQSNLGAGSTFTLVLPYSKP